MTIHYSSFIEQKVSLRSVCPCVKSERYYVKFDADLPVRRVAVGLSSAHSSAVDYRCVQNGLIRYPS
ncbi:hypothetical protein D3C76_163980 [compost metagenome]